MPESEIAIWYEPGSDGENSTENEQITAENPGFPEQYAPFAGPSTTRVPSGSRTCSTGSKPGCVESTLRRTRVPGVPGNARRSTSVGGPSSRVIVVPKAIAEATVSTADVGVGRAACKHRRSTRKRSTNV